MFGNLDEGHRTLPLHHFVWGGGAVQAILCTCTPSGPSGPHAAANMMAARSSQKMMAARSSQNIDGRTQQPKHDGDSGPHAKVTNRRALDLEKMLYFQPKSSSDFHKIRSFSVPSFSELQWIPLYKKGGSLKLGTENRERRLYKKGGCTGGCLGRHWARSPLVRLHMLSPLHAGLCCCCFLPRIP